jgi:hypothetical protein
MRVWFIIKQRRPRWSGSVRRPLLALAALASVGALAAGCGSSNNSNSGSGGGVYGAGGTSTTGSGTSAVAIVTAATTKLGMILVDGSGRTLYYYSADSKPGQLNGEGVDAFGAEWYVLGPAGGKVEGASS